MGFAEKSNTLSSIVSERSIKTATQVTTIAGVATVGAASGAMSLAGLFGVVLGAMAKFFQVIEFTGMLVFFNIDYDLVIENLLTMVENIGDFDVFDLPFENSMKEKVQNSSASKWRGKFSKMEKATWQLMDIGLTGVYLGLVYFI